MHDEDDDVNYVSKSQVKRDLLALQELGLKLTVYSRKQLEPLNLPEDLVDALVSYRKIPQGPAMRRQRQYIGKQLRQVDEEAIRQFISIKEGDSDQHNAWLHSLERWRDRLLADPQTLTALLTEFPAGDVQSLRTLIRNAKKEKEENRPPKHYRALYQALKDLIPGPTSALQASTEEDDDE